MQFYRKCGPNNSFRPSSLVKSWILLCSPLPTAKNTERGREGRTWNKERRISLSKDPIQIRQTNRGKRTQLYTKRIPMSNVYWSVTLFCTTSPQYRSDQTLKTVLPDYFSINLNLLEEHPETCWLERCYKPIIFPLPVNIMYEQIFFVVHILQVSTHGVAEANWLRTRLWTTNNKG